MIGDSPKSFDIPNVDEASPQFYGSFVLYWPKALVTASRLAPIMVPRRSWV